MVQPVTARQLSQMANYSVMQCVQVVATLRNAALVYCVNPDARRSRLYFLTKKGVREQRKLRQAAKLSVLTHDLPDIDWGLYGWVCFSHRSLVITTLTKPMPPFRIKRVAYGNNPRVRFSSDNCRVVIYDFLAHGIVRRVKAKGRRYVCYELTKLGLHMQRLLWQTNVRW